MNNVVLTGRLGADPEMKYSTSGTAITKFRIAVKRFGKSEEGKQDTDWLDIVCFNKTAENAANYLNKGSLVGVEGRIQARQWETNEGQKRTAVEIVANNVEFLESKKDAEARRQYTEDPTPTAVPEVPAGEDYFG